MSWGAGSEARRRAGLPPVPPPRPQCKPKWDGAFGQASRVCPFCGARGAVVQGGETHRGEFGNGKLLACVLTLGLMWPVFLLLDNPRERKTWCTNCGMVMS